MTQSLAPTDSGSDSVPEPKAQSPEPSPPSVFEASMTPKKYIIGVLYYGAIDAKHLECMKAIENHPFVSQVVSLFGCPYIDIGRCVLAEYVRVLDAGGILFIDHDILFTPEDVSRIIVDAEQTGGIVGGGYSMRSPGSTMIGGIDVLACQEDIIFFEGGKVYPAGYLGMGFTAMSRRAMEQVAKDMPFLQSGITPMKVQPMFSLLQQDGNYYGEDVSFCLRAKKAGVPLFMDTRIRLYHKGTYEYGLEDCGIVVPYLDQLKAVKKDPEKPFIHATTTPHQEIERARAEASPALTTALSTTLPSNDPEETFPRSRDPLSSSEPVAEVL